MNVNQNSTTSPFLSTFSISDRPCQIKRTVPFNSALYLAQNGLKHPQAKPLKGFGSAGVLEIVEDNNNGVYVLHCFQKKSQKGIETSKHDINLIEARLKMALIHSEGA